MHFRYRYITKLLDQTNQQTYLSSVLQQMLTAVTAQVLANSSLEDYLAKLVKFLQIYITEIEPWHWSIPATIVEVCDATLLHSFWSQIVMGILPSNQKKSRISRVHIASCGLLPGRENLAARWAIERTNRIHLSSSKIVSQKGPVVVSWRSLSHCWQD